jgi:hypothetical protein
VKDGEAVPPPRRWTSRAGAGRPVALAVVRLDANVDQSVEKAKSLGGTLVAGPFDVMEHGRMAVLTDPTGATFALWQANQHPGRHAPQRGRHAGVDRAA